MTDKAKGLFYKIYNRFPVVFNYGGGMEPYDTGGTEYLDFEAGIAVMVLGYHNTKHTGTMQEQMEKLLHTPNLFYDQPSMNAVGELLAMFGMGRVFFTSSGTEATEGTLKVAGRCVYNRNSHGDHKIITTEYSFHDRSIDALSVASNDRYQEPFRPLLPGAKFMVFNNLDSMETLVSGSTCAIIMGTIQGESGIYPATEEFL